MRMIGLLVVLFAASPVAAESCIWKFGWPARSECECRQLGYHKGTPLFLQCFQIMMAQHGQDSQRMLDMSRQFLQPVQPAPQIRNCQTRWVAALGKRRASDQKRVTMAARTVGIWISGY